MTRALAEVGRPGPARDVLDGGDVDPATGRLLSVGALQAALRAARGASGRPPTADYGSVGLAPGGQPAAARPAPASAWPPAQAPADATVPGTAPSATTRAGRGGRPAAAPTGPGVLRPPPGRRWVAVVGAHRGAGASTVALALADAAATAGWPVHLVSCNAPAECGLVGAATVELGTDPTGAWRTGRRGAGVTLARPAPGRDLITRAAASQGSADPGPGSAWPPLPPGVDERDLLTVVDAEAGAARAPQLLATAAAVLLVCRVSVPGVHDVEQLLDALLRLTRADASHDSSARGNPARYDPAHGDAGPVVLVAAVGDLSWSSRWPRAVRRAAGPLLSQLLATDRVVTVPLDHHLAIYRPTGTALPRAVIRSAAQAVRLLEGTGALRRPQSTSPDPHTGTARPAPAQPPPDPLLDAALPSDKDTH